MSPRSAGAIERSSVKRRCGTGVALFLTVGAGLALAGQAASETPQWKYDPENARDILETCAACHGKNGEGGKNGTYPRLAGLKADYIAKQLRAFKARDRVNIPMYPYATEREMSSLGLEKQITGSVVDRFGDPDAVRRHLDAIGHPEWAESDAP